MDSPLKTPIIQTPIIQTPIIMTATKSNCLPLSEKVKILEEIDKGVGVTALSGKYGVAKSTICKFKKNRHLIITAASNCGMPGGPGKKKTLKDATYPKMEKALYMWYLTQRENQLPISGFMLKEKAKLFHQALNETNHFIASDGWLQRFKSRYNIKFPTKSKDKLSSRPESDAVACINVTEVNELINFINQDVTCTPDLHLWNEDGHKSDENDCQEDSDGSVVEIVPETKKSIISDNQAVDVFNKAMEWAAENGASYCDMLVLQRLRSKADEKRLKKKLIQTKLTSYFSKVNSTV